MWIDSIENLIFCHLLEVLLIHSSNSLFIKISWLLRHDWWFGIVHLMCLCLFLSNFSLKYFSMWSNRLDFSALDWKTSNWCILIANNFLTWFKVFLKSSNVITLTCYFIVQLFYSVTNREGLFQCQILLYNFWTSWTVEWIAGWVIVAHIEPTFKRTILDFVVVAIVHLLTASSNILLLGLRYVYFALTVVFLLFVCISFLFRTISSAWITSLSLLVLLINLFLVLIES